MIVFDFDDADAQATFIQKFPRLMDTYFVKSGGRGTLHIYFEVDFSVRTTKIRGGDLKAEGSYVVGAGSHIGGGTWEVFRDLPLNSLILYHQTISNPCIIHLFSNSTVVMKHCSALDV